MTLKDRLKNTWLYRIYKKRELYALKKQIDEKFPDNEFIPVKRFNLDLLEAGKYSYGELNIVTFGETAKLKIGSCVSIAQCVKFILDAEHYVNHLSTFPFKVKILKNEPMEAFSKGDILVDDDVWIGYGATILSGVRIGQGAVVAAGAIVTKDVNPYSIVGGVPAKEIKKRFTDDIIDYLMTLDYQKLDNEIIHDHEKELYQSIDDKDLTEIKNMFSWFPKKDKRI